MENFLLPADTESIGAADVFQDRRHNLYSYLQRGTFPWIVTMILLFIFFHLGVIEAVFGKLEITKQDVHFGMLLAIVLSLINLNVFSVKVAGCSVESLEKDNDRAIEPDTEIGSSLQKVPIALNLGGCVVPVFFALYFMRDLVPDIFLTLILITLVSLAVYPFTRIRHRSGLVIHLFSAICTAAIGALVLGGDNYLQWAYLAAVLGTLIGGDLLHLTQLLQQNRIWKRGVFIGGAGLMDAIFLSGIFAMLVAETIHQQQWLT